LRALASSVSDLRPLSFSGVQESALRVASLRRAQGRLATAPRNDRPVPTLQQPCLKDGMLLTIGETRAKMGVTFHLSSVNRKQLSVFVNRSAALLARPFIVRRLTEGSDRFSMSVG
jgi:hypothetical protein